MTEPPAFFNDVIRRQFAQHVLKLVNDNHEGYGYQVTSVVERATQTLIVFESDRPVVSRAPGISGRETMYWGTRRLKVLIEGEYELQQ